MIHDHGTVGHVFKQAHLGGDRNFCYLIGDKASGEGIAVDPGFDAPAFAALAAAEGLTIGHILLTHTHADHCAEAERLARMTGAGIWAGSTDPVRQARLLTDGQEIPLGRESVRALATPGHAPDHFCFLWRDKLITGDLLFCGKIGGTGSYFPGSDAAIQYASLARILKLPDVTFVFPGHDYYGGPGKRPHSTIGHEKETNPFLTVPDFAAFIHLKENWARYKKEHGIK
ncbi:MBL fold metallo-hydrolase [bacterium DOLJORAL78_65_58]|nr:MAG: MBL fold metallo-hydrolase [bacterium DOLZORAL124_64_63]PIE75686.1 MAG: MBL fold metallo-hydrolase [bacterium DOLJORAL78_65_58]